MTFNQILRHSDNRVQNDIILLYCLISSSFFQLFMIIYVTNLGQHPRDMLSFFKFNNLVLIFFYNCTTT